MSSVVDAGNGALMFRFEWNALRVGDRVQVHDDSDLRTALIDGTVTIVEADPTGQGNNEVAIRLSGRRERVIRPRRQAVHTVSTDSQSCWRCQMFAPRRAAEERARRAVPDDRSWSFSEPGRPDLVEAARVSAMLRPSISRSERRP